MVSSCKASVPSRGAWILQQLLLPTGAQAGPTGGLHPARGSSTFSLPVTMLSDVSLHPLPPTRCSVGNQILSSHFPLFEESNLSFPPESYSM